MTVIFCLELHAQRRVSRCETWFWWHSDTCSHYLSNCCKLTQMK